jgi:hypothetical protein
VSDYNWLSFYEVFDKFIKGEPRKNFKKMVKYMESGIFMCVQLDGLCVVCGHPKIKRDDKGRLHSIKEQAVIFPDGYSQYYINGIGFTKEEFEKFSQGKMSALEIMNWKNQDQKRVMAMNYGNDKLIKELNAKELSREKDACGNDMVLWKIEQEEEPMIFYEGIDNSKNEKIYLRLPPEFEKRRPIEAKLWTFKELWEEYQETGVLPEFVMET